MAFLLSLLLVDTKVDLKLEENDGCLASVRGYVQPQPPKCAGVALDAPSCRPIRQSPPDQSGLSTPSLLKGGPVGIHVELSEATLEADVMFEKQIQFPSVPFLCNNYKPARLYNGNLQKIPGAQSKAVFFPFPNFPKLSQYANPKQPRVISPSRIS